MTRAWPSGSRAVDHDTRLYKQAYIQKELKPTHLKQRLDYAKTHQNHTIENHWQFALFTDEAHYDPGSKSQGRILRELGDRYRPESIQQRGSLSGNQLHFAAWVSWHTKAPKLTFYHDEESININHNA